MYELNFDNADWTLPGVHDAARCTNEVDGTE